MNKPFLFAAIVLLLCLPLAVPVQADTITKLIVNSPAGDYIGQGESYTLTPADGSFHMERDFMSQNGVSLFFHQGDLVYTQWWQIDFGGPNKETLAVGPYPNAGRLGFQPAGCPGLQASTGGRCCSDLTGSFEIKYLVYDEAGEVVSFWATAEQSCEGFMPPLKLEIMYNMDSATPALQTSWGRVKTLYR